jgi:hypothetical protein
MKLVRHTETSAHEFQDRIGADIIFLVCEQPHLDAGEDQKGGEDIKHPAELLDQRGAQADHDRTQDDDAQYAPEQHPVLIEARHREIGEDHGNDEDIVHRQALLDHKPGQIVHARAGAHVPPDPAAKGEAQQDIDGGRDEALRDADLLRLAVDDTQINHQKDGDDGEEAQPQPERLAEPVKKQEIHILSSCGHTQVPRLSLRHRRSSLPAGPGGIGNEAAATVAAAAARLSRTAPRGSSSAACDRAVDSCPDIRASARAVPWAVAAGWRERAPRCAR